MFKMLDVIDFGCRKLSKCSSDPECESLIFLEEATGRKREEILVGEKGIEKEKFDIFKDFLKRRMAGEPWQYIVGKTNFLGLDILVEKEVFIPRPETEFMTASAIRILKKIENPFILEIGCGTGAISIAIAHNIEKAEIVATDISKKAINLCKKNIYYNNLENRIDIIRADLMDCFSNFLSFDMIISNPPYISVEDIEKLDLIVRNEPELALDGGSGGVYFINEILESSVNILNSGGFIIIEIDDSNIPHLKIPQSIDYSIMKDQYGRNRILQGVKI
jgi:release factor glutamine methyltransferase